MGNATKATRENRTITVDFQNEATYVQLFGEGKAFVECVLAFLLALGFQLTHKATCHGSGCLTRDPLIMRVSALVASRSGGFNAPPVKHVFTVLPHFVLRY